MRFSSISLIAVALAAISGSTVAAPGPLHARALGEVTNSFERDLDVESRVEREMDDLSVLIRRADKEHLDVWHTLAADSLHSAVVAYDQAAHHSLIASKRATTSDDKQKYLNIHQIHQQRAASFALVRDQHRSAASSQERNDALRGIAAHDVLHAHKHIIQANEVSAEAMRFSQGHEGSLAGSENNHR